jgi:FlaG/FlaF family flagellin (archaellin)
MKKKGVSPFIATILIIGLVVALGIVLANFFSDLSETQTQHIEDEAYIMSLCTEKTSLNFGRSCFIASPSSVVTIDIENEGAYPVEKINFTFFGDSIIGTAEINESISKYGHRVHNVSMVGPDIKKMAYIKYLAVDNETVICNQIIVDVDIPECGL